MLELGPGGQEGGSHLGKTVPNRGKTKWKGAELSMFEELELECSWGVVEGRNGRKWSPRVQQIPHCRVMARSLDFIL